MTHKEARKAYDELEEVKKQVLAVLRQIEQRQANLTFFMAANPDRDPRR